MFASLAMTKDMTMRTLIRPTGFVDSPFGHDGKVARLAGGLNWFAQVELIHDGRRARELVPVEGIEARFDDAMAADWARLIGAARAAAAGRAHDPARPAAGDGHPQRDARQLLRRRRLRRRRRRRRGRARRWRRQGAAIIDVGGESTRPGAATVWEGDEIERVAAGHPAACRGRHGGVDRHAQGGGDARPRSAPARGWSTTCRR